MHGHEYLGGGRSHMVELFPLSFEEYLHFSRDDFEYGDSYEPTVSDVQGFYRLEGIPNKMKFILDEKYMTDTFEDIEVARANKFQDERDVVLNQEQYVGVFDVIAYTLQSHLSTKHITGHRISKREFIEMDNISWSKSLISLATKIVNKMAVDFKKDIGIVDLAHIIAYLYHAGFLYLDLKSNETSKQSAAEAVRELFLISTFAQFKEYFLKYNFCVISPLLYTRLLVNFEFIAEKMYDNMSLSGDLFELAIKTEIVQQKGYKSYHTSRKYILGTIEIDLWEDRLLLEATVSEKTGDDFHVNKQLTEYELIRVLTCDPSKYVSKDFGWKSTDKFYKIAYPLALLMASRKEIYKLLPCKIPAAGIE